MKHDIMESSKRSAARTRHHGLPHLRVLRQRRGLSLGQLADMTGLRKDTLTHFESGREDPQPYQVRLLALALQVQQMELVS